MFFFITTFGFCAVLAGFTEMQPVTAVDQNCTDVALKNSIGLVTSQWALRLNFVSLKGIFSNFWVFGRQSRIGAAKLLSAGQP